MGAQVGEGRPDREAQEKHRGHGGEPGKGEGPVHRGKGVVHPGCGHRVIVGRWAKGGENFLTVAGFTFGYTPGEAMNKE
ncbi:hypothetical protein DAERI_100064 [Deinococcus aerius]|uniref:Uncharacterized protein n=1 Tax=Deinococcus aerius TaxID=200253 RepID=A0A2I9DNN3_9DEIO|nr:hypothetical protein DAERI_100064 [Deinococcus aerius]